MTAWQRVVDRRASAMLDTDPADDWRTAALCVGEDPELFTSVLVDDQQLAKRVCADCTVRSHCLEWALEVGDGWAVLGGLTPAERRLRTQLKGRFPRRATVTESHELLGTLRRCQRCRTPFTATGKSRYCSQQCRTQAANAMRSGWRARQEAPA